MRYIKYFKSYVLLMVLCVLPESALALIIEKECGKYIVQVEILHENEIDERQYILYYKKGQKKILFYKTEPGLNLEAACIKNTKGRYLILFRENCGGNGCPEDIYGIYDPIENKMIIKPKDWPKGNGEVIEKIIGLPLHFFAYNDKYFFCCSHQLYIFRYGT